MIFFNFSRGYVLLSRSGLSCPNPEEINIHPRAKTTIEKFLALMNTLQPSSSLFFTLLFLKSAKSTIDKKPKNKPEESQSDTPRDRILLKRKHRKMCVGQNFCNEKDEI